MKEWSKLNFRMLIERSHYLLGLPVMKFSKRAFPAWHYSMLNDADRNEKIESAIRSLDLTGKFVFEIGTGAGLTAMLFAHFGAKRILTCEMDTQLYEVARQVFSANNMNDQIDLVNMSSSNVINHGVLNFIPDVIFTETLDCGIVGEGFKDIKNDIKKLAGPKTTVIPHCIRQYGYLVENGDIYNLNFARNHRNFDISILNQYSTRSYFPIRAGIYKSRILTPTFQMRELNYIGPDDDGGSVALRAHLDGICHGVVSYFEAAFGPYVVTNDLRSMSHWHQAFHPLQEPLRIRAGRAYRLVFDFNGTAHLEEIHNEQS